MALPRQQRPAPPQGWTGPARKLVGLITKSDATVYDPPLRLLIVQGAGNVALILDGDDEGDAAAIYIHAAAANEKLGEIAIRQVRSTGTTATGIYGFR